MKVDVFKALGIYRRSRSVSVSTGVGIQSELSRADSPTVEANVDAGRLLRRLAILTTAIAALLWLPAVAVAGGTWTSSD
jgi:hypothetical protein